MAFHLDYETYSEANLRDFGAWRYASDPSTEILLCAVSRDDGPVEIWDRYASPEANAPALALLQDFVIDEEICYAHNAPFEISITHYLWEKTFGFESPKLEQWRCTAALCRVTAIPSSLENAAIFLELNDQKDKVGKALIKVFCVPKKSKRRGTYRNHPEDSGKITVAGSKVLPVDAWNQFRQYCIKDVIVEREVEQKLKLIELKGNQLASFQSDLRMNVRGIPVDVEAVIQAEKLIDEYNSRINERFVELTGLNHSQRDKVFEWLKARGYPEDNLQAATISRITGMECEDDVEEDDEPKELTDEEKKEAEALPDISRMTPEAFEVLRCRALLSFAAIKKLPTMRKAACPDGIVRGVIMWHGAMRTGRDSSKVIQIHNMKRPSINTEAWEEANGEPETHTVYKMVKAGIGDMDTFATVFGPPLECLASAIRHFIAPKEGKFLDIDLAQIEARVLAWVSGHDVLLQAFRDNKDLYKITACLLWNLVYEKVTKDQRFLGKVASLALGYYGGVEAFITMAKTYGTSVTEEKAAEVVKAYRTGNAPIKTLWKKMGEGAIEAVMNPGTWVKVNDKISFGVTSRLGYLVLQMMLPSGRILSYPNPQIKTIYKRQNAEKKWVLIPEWRAINPQTGEKYDGVWQIYELSYYGQLPQSKRWGRITTHGGVLTENACQAIAADFLTHGVLIAEAHGYQTLFKVHDQGVFKFEPDKGQSVDHLTGLMTTVPKWAPGFPLAAEAGVVDFFTK